MNLANMTSDQRNLYADMVAHIMNRGSSIKENKYMIVDAPAGVGKTYTVNNAISYLKLMGYKFLVTSFTGRACMHLSKSGIPARTCHSVIFEPELDEEGNLIRFKHRDLKEIKDEVGDFIVVDEASMLPKEFHDLFAKLGVPIIYLGDSYQLPPVDNENPDFNAMQSIEGYRSYLTKNIRFSDDSGIFWLSKHLKENDGIPRFSKHQDLKIIPKRRLWKEQFHIDNQFDAVLCGTNSMRHKLNEIIRKARGYFHDSPDIPTIGEQVVCLRNDVVSETKINNGEVYIVRQVMPDKVEGVQRFFLECKDNPELKLWVRVEDQCWLSETCGRTDSNKEKTIQMFGFGYAMSVHKSQGSSIPSVLFVDEAVNYFLDQRRFRYTAVTRASETLTVAMI